MAKAPADLAALVAGPAAQGSTASMAEAAVADDAYATGEEPSLGPGAFEAAPGTSHSVVLNDRFQIEPDQPLGGLDLPSAKAYAVTDLRSPGRPLFALVRAPGLVSRVNAMAILRGATGQSVLALVEWGVVEWPLAGRRCMAAIYQRPLGGRFAETYASAGVQLAETEIAMRVLRPMIKTLAWLESRSFAHRAIRPNNFYYLEADKKTLVLGDCLMAPPGFDQPVVFETVERAMASPGGRGEGGLGDDVYALGVSIVFMLLGKNPVGEMTEDEVIDGKIEHGTYHFLCAKERIPLGTVDLLRGLLNDDANERWGIEDLEQWAAGKRLPPPKKKPLRRAPVAFAFKGRDHTNVRTLARAFANSPDEATKAIADGSLELWLRRDLKDIELADAVATSVAVAKGQGPGIEGADDFLVAKICIFLDRAAPIRYRGFSFMPEGFGPALAVEFMRTGNADIPAEVVARDVPPLWFAAQDAFMPAFPGLQKSFAQVRTWLQRREIGFGVERVLYELNPSLPCQSALLEGEYVATIGELLPALDRAAATQDTKLRPLDRHIAAFIAARFSQDVGPHLAALATPDKERSAIGMLSLLALLQWRLEAPAVHGLTAWVGRHLGPAISSYHSRTTRRELEREAPQVVREGSLPELFDLIENAEKRRHDEQGYAAAIAEHADLEAEIDDIENNKEERGKEALQMGQQAASMTSLVIGMIIVSIIFLNYTW